METTTMGRVVVSAKLENIEDSLKARRGELSPDQVRTVVVDDALIDTGASALSLPKSLITRLGLQPVSRKRVRTTKGTIERIIYSALRLTIQGEECTVDAYEVPENVPVLIGQIPLEFMDWVVDLKNRKLIPNPAHGGEHMLEEY